LGFPKGVEVAEDTRQRYVVVFSGVPGTSKSAIADYLSWNFQLGVLRNDSVRFEVKEDMRVKSLSIKEDLMFASINQNGALDEYERRIQERRRAVLSLGHSAIFDGSVDRRWPEVKQDIIDYDFDWFMINMGLSREFLVDLYSGTDRDSFIPQLPAYMEDHQRFLERYAGDIDLAITDVTFPDRLAISADGLSKYLEMEKTHDIR